MGSRGDQKQLYVVELKVVVAGLVGVVEDGAIVVVSGVVELLAVVEDEAVVPSDVIELAVVSGVLETVEDEVVVVDSGVVELAVVENEAVVVDAGLVEPVCCVLSEVETALIAVVVATEMPLLSVDGAWLVDSTVVIWNWVHTHTTHCPEPRIARW
jgi:hypothetical protein